MDEIAKLISNTKTKIRTLDLVEISRLMTKYKEIYGSTDALAKKLSLSKEMVREFLIVNQLPEEVKELIKTRKIDSVDAVKVIYSINGDKKRIEFANAILGLNTQEIRALHDLYVLGNMNLNKAKEIIIGARNLRRYIYVILLDEKSSKVIENESAKRGKEPSTFLKEIIEDWIRRSANVNIK